MYAVNQKFHELIIRNAPVTRVRIYFIGNTVDCTDDNDVRTNGTLLVGKVGDTDSNGRIGQEGISWAELFNPEKNITIGKTCSYQIGLTLLNNDGALSTFTFGRCKVYLDVLDESDGTWYTCPMGVFIIEQPSIMRKQIVNAYGFDQMSYLDHIADTWFDGLNWSSGVSLSDLVTGIATATGLSVSASTSAALLNANVTYTEVPFPCVEMTYRDILEKVAEATGTIARLDRDGALDLRWYSPAQIGGNTVSISTDVVGNQCLSYDLATYSTGQITKLNLKFSNSDTVTSAGSGDNEYNIIDNEFFEAVPSADLPTYAMAIYNRLNGLNSYNPIQASIIADPSIEAGDIINFVSGGNTYAMPILQQTMKWRGGYVLGNILADGDNGQPVTSNIERKEFRTNYTIFRAAEAAEAGAIAVAETAALDEQLVYISKVSGTISVNAPSAWVTDTTGDQNKWTIKRPTYNSAYPVLFVATQKKTVGGTVTCTTPQIDNTTTVIDGGHITTGTIDASVVNVSNLNASNITSGTMSASKISGGTLDLGGNNNENGTVSIYDASGTLCGTIDNTGFETQSTSGQFGTEVSKVGAGYIRLTTNGTDSVILNRDTTDGSGAIQLFDANEAERWLINARTANPFMYLYDDSGKIRLLFAQASGSGVPYIQINDANGTGRLILAQASGTGTPYIQLNDTSGNGRLGLVVESGTGLPSLRMFNSSGVYIGRMYSDGTDMRINLWSEDGSRSITLSTAQNEGLAIGSTVLTQAKLQQLLALI